MHWLWVEWTMIKKQSNDGTSATVIPTTTVPTLWQVGKIYGLECWIIKTRMRQSCQIVKVSHVQRRRVGFWISGFKGLMQSKLLSQLRPNWDIVVARGAGYYELFMGHTALCRHHLCQWWHAFSITYVSIFGPYKRCEQREWNTCNQVGNLVYVSDHQLRIGNRDKRFDRNSIRKLSIMASSIVGLRR